jgi:hypothetical protein
MLMRGVAKASYNEVSADVTPQPVRIAKISRFTKMLAKIHDLTRSAHVEIHGQPLNSKIMGEPVDYPEYGSVTFTITPCDGGILITTKTMTNSRDFELNHRKYVVPDGANLGERIDTIFGFESIKKS